MVSWISDTAGSLTLLLGAGDSFAAVGTTPIDRSATWPYEDGEPGRFSYSRFSSPTVTEAEWRKMAKHWRGTGVLDNEDNELAVTQSTPAAMSVQVDTGKAWIQGHYMGSDAAVTKALSPGDPSNPRIDRIVVQADFVNNTIDIVVLEGTPGASPSAPTLTQDASTWEISLAQVDVATGATSVVDADITDERTFSAAPGSTPVGALVQYAGGAADW